MDVDVSGVVLVPLRVSRPTALRPDRRSPDERCMSSFPSRFRDLEVGWRLDALDNQGGWYASTIVEVSTVP